VTFTETKRVVFGRPAGEVLREQAEVMDARRVLLIASTSLCTRTDAVAGIAAALGDRHAGTFHGIAPHAPRSDVLRAVEAARAAKADLIVSIGGGSVTDATKIVALALKHDVRRVEDFEPLRTRVDADGRAVNPLTEGPDIRVIAVPTTLSGGEFNPRSGATDERTQHKQGYGHPAMVPAAIILDPALTVHTPEWVWLSTGVRAVDHAVETLASLRSNDYADGLADSALRLLMEGLTRAKADPANLEARLKCQIGAWQAMMPVLAGVPMGASHAIGHVLGGTCGVPHGYTSCILSPAVLAWNAEVDARRQGRILQCLGGGYETASKALHAFVRDLGMPRTLGEVGVGADRLDAVADYAMRDLWLRTNPRPIRSREDVLEILRMAA
jgi:alcohol dehydrogenase class IV